MDGFHRVVSANPLTSRQVRLAGFFALAWFAIDAHQYGDFLWTKFNPPE